MMIGEGGRRRPVTSYKPASAKPELANSCLWPKVRGGRPRRFF